MLTFEQIVANELEPTGMTALPTRQALVNAFNAVKATTNDLDTLVALQALLMQEGCDDSRDGYLTTLCDTVMYG